MADYIFVHDRPAFERQRAALADSYARRNFRGWSTLLGGWRESALRYAQAFHIDPGEILLSSLEPTTPFSPALWRAVVGELLAVTAEEMPELPGHLESLARLLPGPLARQALRGCADLTFGLSTYRPGKAGYNSEEANRRLFDELRAVDPSAWTESLLASEGVDPGDAHEELLYVRDGFAAVLGLYERVVAAGRILVFEDIQG